MSSVDPLPTDETSAVAALYQQLLASWNARDATAYAGLFAADGNLVGFDGSQVDGPAGMTLRVGAKRHRGAPRPDLRRPPNPDLCGEDPRGAGSRS